jgi:hypothetical protein
VIGQTTIPDSVSREKSAPIVDPQAEPAIHLRRIDNRQSPSMSLVSALTAGHCH